MRDWSDQDEFYVLRNKFVLRSLQNSLDNRVKVNYYFLLTGIMHVVTHGIFSILVSLLGMSD